MVTQSTNLTRNGVTDWIVQRASAAILAAYTVFLVGYCAIVDVNFEVWHALFQQTWMQIFTLLALLSTCAHAWIGMWTVGTDYLREHTAGEGANTLRFLFEMGCTIVLLVYLIWGVKVVWGL